MRLTPTARRTSACRGAARSADRVRAHRRPRASIRTPIIGTTVPTLWVPSSLARPAASLIAQRPRPSTAGGSGAGVVTSSRALVVAAIALALVGSVSRCGSRSRSTKRHVSLNPEIELVEIVTLTEQGRLEEAYERALRARSAAPRSAAAASAAAYALTYAGFIDDAVRAVDDVLAENPTTSNTTAGGRRPRCSTSGNSTAFCTRCEAWTRRPPSCIARSPRPNAAGERTRSRTWPESNL